MIGYKCFYSGLINRYGIRFDIGKTYYTNGEIKYGNKGNGFHMCSNLEDTLRYFDAFYDYVDICLVEGYGKTDCFEDEYNGYYDMYACEYLRIIKVLTREEIIDYALNLNEMRVKRFISQFKLNKEEIELFKNKFSKYPDVLNCIAYYQENKKDVYMKLAKQK